MSELPDWLSKNLRPLMIVAVIAVSVAALAGAAVYERIDFSLPVAAAALVALLTATLLSLLPRARRQRNWVPIWYQIAVLIQVATIGALLALLAVTLASSLAFLINWASSASLAQTGMRALALLLFASLFLRFSGFLALEVHRLLRKATPAPPPEAQ